MTKWYKFFNKPHIDESEVLCKNEIIRVNDIIVAKKIIQDNPYYIFTKLNDINQYCNLYNSVSENEQTFHAVLYNEIRYFYIDIDYKIKNTMSPSYKSCLIYKIISLCKDFFDQYAINYFSESFELRCI